MKPYDICDEIDPRNTLQEAFGHRYINEWDEVEEEDDCRDETLDPAFRSWEDVNGMFFRRNW